jgi:hypothetical protein
MKRYLGACTLCVALLVGGDVRAQDAQPANADDRSEKLTWGGAGAVVGGLGLGLGVLSQFDELPGRGMGGIVYVAITAIGFAGAATGVALTFAGAALTPRTPPLTGTEKAGVALASVGAAGLVAGGIATAVGYGATYTSDGVEQSCRGDRGAPGCGAWYGGFTTIAAGGLSYAVGMVMLRYGASAEPAASSEARRSHQMMPELDLGVGSAGLRWQW